MHAECASRRYKSLENTLESRSTRLDALNTVMGEMRLKVERGDARVKRRRGGETAERNGDIGRGRGIEWEEAENEEKVLVKERFTFSAKLEGTEELGKRGWKTPLHGGLIDRNSQKYN